MWSLLFNYWGVYLSKNHMNRTQQGLVLAANFCCLIQGLIMYFMWVILYRNQVHGFRSIKIIKETKKSNGAVKTRWLWRPGKVHC